MKNRNFNGPSYLHVKFNMVISSVDDVRHLAVLSYVAASRRKLPKSSRFEEK